MDGPAGGKKQIPLKIKTWKIRSSISESENLNRIKLHWS